MVIQMLFLDVSIAACIHTYLGPGARKQTAMPEHPAAPQPFPLRLPVLFWLPGLSAPGLSQGTALAGSEVRDSTELGALCCLQPPRVAGRVLVCGEGAPRTPRSRAGPPVPCAVGGGVGLHREVPALPAGCPGDVLGANEQEDGEGRRKISWPG